MDLSTLTYAKGSRKPRKRVARGTGSGHGKTATRGMNGQMSRSGAKKKAWFEGGQMPLQRRVPKFGFKPPFRVPFQPVNLYQIQRLAEKGKLNVETVTVKDFLELGLISSVTKPYKVLGHGDLKVKLTIEANAFSKSAIEKIEAIGGSVKTI